MARPTSSARCMKGYSRKGSSCTTLSGTCLPALVVVVVVGAGKGAVSLLQGVLAQYLTRSATAQEATVEAEHLVGVAVDHVEVVRHHEHRQLLVLLQVVDELSLIHISEPTRLGMIS